MLYFLTLFLIHHICFGSIGYSFDVSLSHSQTSNEIVVKYFENFERLAKSENWKEIISQGQSALAAAKTSGRKSDEAKICAQLTSTAFYLGDYDLALAYANRCHQLSESFEDSSLFIRALYLESAVHRALAGKKSEQEQQGAYQLAITIAEEAMQVYTEKKLDNPNLEGKVFFNWGAAHADNPKGDLDKAAHCYTSALMCFKKANAVDDVVRTRVRLGKVYLLQEKYDLSQEIINEARSQVLSERITMQVDYLEAQLKFALHDFPNALRIADYGCKRAKKLEAKEDEIRFATLIEKLHASINRPLA